MNAIEQLLAIDANKIKKNEGNCEIHLSRINETIDFDIKEVDAERYTELMEQSLKFDDDGDIMLSTYNQKVFMIVEGCATVRDDRVLEHFKVETPKDLIEKIMTSGEMDELHKAINRLSGHKKIGKDEKDIVDKAKN